MINYEGISYNLETIIEFKSLKLLLEALAKKQIEHNILFCGKNNININKNDSEVKIGNDDKSNTEENFEKIWIEKINNSGLVKEFIESQKKLLEQNKLINELKERIELLERNKGKTREERLTKKITNREKDKEKENFDNNNTQDNINKEQQKEKEKEVNNEEIVKKLEKEKEKNEKINKEKDSKSNEKENIIINQIINQPPIKEKKILNEPINSENKTINIYETKTKTELSQINNNENYNKLEKKLSDLDEKLNLLTEKIEEIEQIADNNINDIDSNKNGISQLNEKIKNLEKITQTPNPEKNKIIIPQEEIKREGERKNNNFDEKKLENELNIFEDKMIKIIDQKLKEMKRTKSDSNLVKEINTEKEKLKEITDKINNEINKLKIKEEEIEDKLKSLTSFSEIKSINEKIKMLEQDMEEFATKNDIRHIIGELDKYEKELIKQKSFIVNQKELNNKNRDDINKLKTALNNLKQNFSSLSTLFENNSLTKLIENINNISDTCVEKSDYEKNIKAINKKMNDLQMDVNEHNRNLGEIMPKIRNIIDIEEINKLNRKIDELMLKNNNEAANKSLDKEEIIKNIKSIESQVKIFMKKLENENEKEKLQNENCILASRPVGGFKCASCEAYIGDIKESNIFLPWNKYHGFDRPYRLGSSFSRILQGLNIEQNYNPFLHKKNFLKSENGKRYKSQNESLSVKRVRKIPPLNQITILEENGKKNNIIEINKINNKTVDENLKLSETNALGIISSNKIKNKLNLSLWGIKSLKNFGNEKNILTLNILSKNKKKNNNSFDKDKSNNDIMEENLIKIKRIPKGNKGNKANISSDENENNLVIPSL